MKKLFFLIVCIVFISANVTAQNQGNQKLMDELRKYPVVYNTWQKSNMPILTGNTEMGGLTDPLGRGIYNIDMANLWLSSSRRSVGAGMMLKIAQFSGVQPAFYKQEYDLTTGILTTKLVYPDGGYHSELFFSQDNKELMVYTYTNDGTDDLICNIDFGLFDMDFVSNSSNTISGISKEGAYTQLRYHLRSNIDFNYDKFPKGNDVWVRVAPKKRLEIVVQIRAGKNIPQQVLPESYDIEKLKSDHVNAWKKNWASMGSVILPEGDYAKLYYRSLHWLQCVSGSEQYLPSEAQFGTLTSRMAAEYNYFGNIELNHHTWQGHSFTYGAGWSAYAYTMYGDKVRAGKMLNNLYKPEALKKNATTMFPVGEYEFVYNGKPRGKYTYLKNTNPEAIAFAHEQYDNGENINVSPWDKQIHIQGYAPALFYMYSRYFDCGKDTAYAVLKGAAEFWSEMLNYDSKTKRYSLPPVLSLTEDLFEKDLLDGLLAAKWVLSEASKMAWIRNEDPQLQKKWKWISGHIKLDDRDNIYQEFAGDDGTRSGGGYMGIRGYVYLGFPTMDLKPVLSPLKVAKSLDEAWIRNNKGKGMITFLANWFAMTDAYWGRGEEALEKSSYCLTQLDASGTALSESDQHLHYFLTGYSTFTMVPVTMVLQSINDQVYVFPAVPKAFSNIEFYDLPAIHGLKVSGVMKNGDVKEVVFRKDGKELLRLQKKAVVQVTMKNNNLVIRSL